MRLWDRSIAPLSAGVENFQSHILKRKDQKKMYAWGDWKSFLPYIFAWMSGLLCSLLKKYFVKYDFLLKVQLLMLILICFSQATI